MDQLASSGRNGFDGFDAHPIRVRAPRDYDGIGEALRDAFRDPPNSSEQMGAVLRALDAID